ncbi:MAG: hypothetical protein PUC59_02810 [Firmicutes bacterium]|nr:hypothetical protein [Bacillota bacterium]
MGLYPRIRKCYNNIVSGRTKTEDAFLCDGLKLLQELIGRFQSSVLS